MRSFLDQYASKNSLATTTPAVAPVVPEPKRTGLGGVIDSVTSFFGGGPKEPAAPTKPPRVSALDRYAEANNFQRTSTPEEAKVATQAAFLDTTPPEVRETGAKAYKISTSTPSTVAPKPRVTMPTQAQLDNPAIAKAYYEALEADKPKGLVDTLKSGWDAYSSGLKRTSTNIAIGEIGTVQSMLDFFTYLGDNPNTVANKIGLNKITKEGADNMQKWIDAAVESQGDQTFSDQLAQGVGSSAVFFLPGLGIAKGSAMLATVSPKLALLFGGSVSTALESMAEAGNTYRAVLTEKQNFVKNNADVKIDPTTMQQDAAEAATKDFWANVILIAITNRFGAFNPNMSGFVRRMIFSAPLEGVQEAGQAIIQNAAMEKEDLLEGAGTSFLIGSIIGGGMGAGVETLMQQSQTTIDPQDIANTEAAIGSPEAVGEKTVFRWDGDTQAETALNAHPVGTVGEGSYFAFDPESSADFGSTLEKLALPKDIKILDLTEGVPAKAGFAGSVDSLSIENPKVRAAYDAGFDSSTMLEYAKSQGYDGVKFYADNGTSKWLALDPKIKLAPASVASSAGMDIDRAIEAGDIERSVVYQGDSDILTPEYAKGRIDDVALKLEKLSPELAEEFRSSIDPAKTTMKQIVTLGDAIAASAGTTATVGPQDALVGRIPPAEPVQETPGEAKEPEAAPSKEGAPAAVQAPQEGEQETIYYHGTSPEDAAAIVQSGFNTANVALTPDIEEALDYSGGDIAGVVAVRVKKDARDVDTSTREPLYNPGDVRVVGMAEARVSQNPPDGARVIELKPEDLDKEIRVATQRNIERGAGSSLAIPSVAQEKARESVRRTVNLNGKTFDRPEQLVTKTQVRDILKAADTDTLDFTVTEQGGEKFLKNETDRSRTMLRPRALGLIESELKDGDTVRITAANLKEKGTAFRAHGSGGALAFNIKNFEDGVLDSEKGETEVDKIIKRSEIAQDLAKKLGVPVRSGHFKQQALGIFKPWAHVIRLKSKLGDIRIPVLVHEAAHFIDYTLLGQPKTTPSGKSWVTEKFVSDMIPRAELDPLLSEYGGTPHSKKREAFAEFVRFWVTEPAKAAEKAPKFLQIWEKQILPDFPEVRDTLNTTKADWERWNKMPAVAKVVSQISFGERGKSLADLKDSIVQSWHDLLSQWTDDLYPVKRFTDLARSKGVEFDIEKDPYILARLTRGWLGKAAVFLEKGTFDVRFWKEVNGKAEPAFTGKGFADILAPIVKKNASEDLAAYLVARRAIDLNERGIHSGVNTQVAKDALKELEVKHPEMAAVASELDAYQNSLLDYLYHSGLLTQESHNKMRNLMKDYVPFFRVMEEAETKGLSGKTLANIRAPIKRIKGSDRDIINPLESIVKNTYALINAAERNRVGIALVNLSTKHPELGQMFEKVPEEKVKVASVKINDLIDQVSGGQIFGNEAENAKELLGGMGEQIVNIFKPSFLHDDNILTVMIEGKPQSFFVDTDMYKALHASEVEDVGLVWKLLAYPARWLRAGATLTPEFMVRNPARDMMSAYVYSDHGFMPPIDMARGLYGVFAKDNAYWLWRMGGGEQAMLVSMDRTTLKKTYEDLAAEHNITSVKGVLHMAGKYKNPLEVLRLFSEFSEKMTRVGEAKKAIARGANPLEAAFSSREVTLDFGKIGSKARSVNMIVAFFNAQIQGSVRMVRAFKEKPYRTTAKTLFGITLPSVLLALWNAQEPDWPEIPQWQKNLFWMIKINGTWWRFPKPFELGIIFGSLPERIVESIMYNDTNVFPELRKSILDGATPSFLPTSILPIIENITNYSFFLDRNLVPDSAEGLPAFAQYTAYTSETAKHIGKWLSYSPAKIDNLISGYFAGLGRYATQIIDSMEAKVRGKEAAPVAPEGTLSDIPVIKAFVVRDPVTSSSESTNRFYIKAEQALAAKNYYNNLLKRQDTKEAEQWYADHGAEIALSTYYEKTRQNIATLRRIQNEARDSKTMTAKEKRERIDEIGAYITDLSQKAITITLKDP